MLTRNKLDQSKEVNKQTLDNQLNVDKFQDYLTRNEVVFEQKIARMKLRVSRKRRELDKLEGQTSQANLILSDHARQYELDQMTLKMSSQEIFFSANKSEARSVLL